MELVFPNTRMQLYQPVSPSFMDFYFISSDTTIGAIPDNSVYTVKFYSQAAGALIGTESPLHSFSQVIPARPYKNSELNASLFPVFTNVSSHALAASQIPGQLNVAWTNPSVSTFDNAELYAADDESSQDWFNVEVTPGTTSATIDTRGINFTPTVAVLGLWGYDQYNREYSSGWIFSGGAPASPANVVISGVMKTDDEVSVPVHGLTITARHANDVDNSNFIAQTTSAADGSYSLSVPNGSDVYLNVSGSSGGTTYASFNTRIWRNLTQPLDLSERNGPGLLPLAWMNTALSTVTCGTAPCGSMTGKGWFLQDAFTSAVDMNDKVAGVSFSISPSITFFGYGVGNTYTAPPTLTATGTEDTAMSSALGYNTTATIISVTASKSGKADQSYELPIIPGEAIYIEIGY